ncbi:MAG: protein jag [Candidatus Paceibacterota bacterium]
MEEKKENETTLELARSFFNAMGIAYEDLTVKEEDGRLNVLLYSKNDSKILIGKGGANLISLTLILNLIVKKKIGPEAQIFVDINDYHKENLDMIKKKALMVAERVRSFQVDMELDPMNPMERRFVHSLFSNDPGVMTESKGTGRDRRVVVKVKKE